MQIFEMINSIYGKLDDLFLFCSVVEKGSLSSAAETLNLPTATLSRRISTLEKSLGMQLLLISKRCLVPTDAGKALYQSCFQNMWQLDHTLQQFQKDSSKLGGMVRIIAPRAFYYDVLRHTARELQERYENLYFQLEASQVPNISALNDKADIAIVFSVDDFENFVAKPLYRTKSGIFVHKDFFKGKKKPKTLKDLENYTWCSNHPVKNFPIYKEDTYVDTLEVQPKYVVNDIHASADEVRLGRCIGCLPIGKASKHKELVRIFPEYNLKITQLSIVYRKTKYTSLSVLEVVNKIQEEARTWYAKNNDWEKAKFIPTLLFEDPSGGLCDDRAETD